MAVVNISPESECGAMAHRRGTDNENRFLAAFCEAAWKQPDWYRSIRRATFQEDSDGYDFFIGTSRDTIGIQVKSSEAYIAQYWKRHPHSKAIIVVVRMAHPYRLIRATTISKINAQW